MARRRAAAGRRYLPFALLAVVGGLTIGLLLSRPPLQRQPAVPAVPPPAGPTPATAVRPGPVTPPQSEVVGVDDGALAAAVRRALAGVGEIVAETEATQSEQAGDIHL